MFNQLPFKCCAIHPPPIGCFRRGWSWIMITYADKDMIYLVFHKSVFKFCLVREVECCP